ncbi:MAG TPA: hypothetical protein PLY66_02865 [Acidobacteriota bacterium]|nr:hypothetical protein [Acidobacteriota bacterium]HQF88171.1 hypothetical protein [Acidobacteriota bacterium]HQG92309.1 hypothetical protein [Acidobacteriota bacterium]HQK86453.1 hypothetical protein [Acidobacteriota bacterium]
MDTIAVPRVAPDDEIPFDRQADHDPGEIHFKVFQPEDRDITSGLFQKVPGRPPILLIILRTGGRTEFRADGDRVAHRYAAVTIQPERGRQVNARHAEALVAQAQELGNRIDVQPVEPESVRRQQLNL